MDNEIISQYNMYYNCIHKFILDLLYNMTLMYWRLYHMVVGFTSTYVIIACHN